MKNKIMRYTVTLGLALAVIISVTGCDMSALDITKKSNRTVHVVGEHDQKSAYWKNNVREQLNDGNSSPISANSVVVYEGDVYIAGNYDSGSGGRACFWKNGDRKDLETTVRSYAYAIFPYDNDIYIAGMRDITIDHSDQHACYWRWEDAAPPVINTQELGDITGKALSIFIGGGTVYTAGYQTDDDAFYWIDGTQQSLLAQPGKARGITRTGSTIHIVGYGNDAGTDKAFYWVSGTGRTYLSANVSDAHGITVVGDDVYIAGEDNGYACYWKNGVKKSLSSDPSVAYAIQVLDGDVYVCGFYIYGDCSPTCYDVACYWENGERKDLSRVSDASARAYSIFVEQN